MLNLVPTLPPTLEAMVIPNKLSLSNFKFMAPKHQNLNKDEKQALINLMNDNTIDIGPANIGSAVDILNKHNYIKETDRQLDDKPSISGQNGT